MVDVTFGFNAYLNQKRTETIHTDYDEARNITSADSTDSHYRYQELYTALNKLPPKERTSVMLYYMQGYSLKEIAEI